MQQLQMQPQQHRSRGHQRKSESILLAPPTEAALATVEANADSFNEATKVAGRRLGNLTVVHAMLRELGDGELRRHLLKRAAKGLIKKPRLSVDPRLHLMLDKEVNAKVG